MVSDLSLPPGRPRAGDDVCGVESPPVLLDEPVPAGALQERLTTRRPQSRCPTSHSHSAPIPMPVPGSARAMELYREVRKSSLHSASGPFIFHLRSPVGSVNLEGEAGQLCPARRVPCSSPASPPSPPPPPPTPSSPSPAPWPAAGGRAATPSTPSTYPSPLRRPPDTPSPHCFVSGDSKAPP